MIPKRIRVLLALLAAAASATAGEDDALLTFSTSGPDRYADGSSVMEGEVYALVWTRDGAAFAGVNLDGSLVRPDDSVFVIAQPNARVKVVDGELCGYCPPTIFQVKAGFEAGHPGGTYQVVLLDTRAPLEDGTLRPAGPDGRVQGWGVVTTLTHKPVAGGLSFMKNSLAAPMTARTTTASALPPELDELKPRITSFSVEDGVVRLTFTGGSGALLYNIAAGGTPAADENRHAAFRPAAGANDVSAEVTLSAPVREGQRFFKIIRNP
ncbi:MAG: hypothetical protein J6T01_06185 [Kiritimatiellae bacterium]|nr:hypothetical protein [Kiritimatiellia bacterium]